MSMERATSLLIPGGGVEAAQPVLRLLRFEGSLRGTDLQFAALRNRVVNEFVLHFAPSNDERWVDRLVEEIIVQPNYASVLALVYTTATARSLEVEEGTLPSEEVPAMGGVSSVVVDGTHVSVVADLEGFQITDKDVESPCARGAVGLAHDAMVFLNWASTHTSSLAVMTFAELLHELALLEIRVSDAFPWYDYC